MDKGTWVVFFRIARRIPRVFFHGIITGLFADNMDFRYMTRRMSFFKKDAGSASCKATNLV